MNKIQKLLLSAFFLIGLSSLAQANHGMGGGCGLQGKSAGLLLVTMAIGYWVLTLSEKMADRKKLLGQIVSGIIIVVSIGGLLCAAVCGIRMSCAKKNSACAMPMKAGCPMGGSSMAEPMSTTIPEVKK